MEDSPAQSITNLTSQCVNTLSLCWCNKHFSNQQRDIKGNKQINNLRITLNTFQFVDMSSARVYVLIDLVYLPPPKFLKAVFFCNCSSSLSFSCIRMCIFTPCIYIHICPKSLTNEKQRDSRSSGIF